MSLPVSTSILASFATLKTLNDAKQYNSSYQILSEFVSYIIAKKSIFAFTAEEMKGHLFTVFGFDIPEAVVRTTCRGISYVERAGHRFVVDKGRLLENPLFLDLKETAEAKNSSIIEQLIEYCRERLPDKTLSVDVLSRDLIAFLVEDQQSTSGQFSSIISEFVLKHETDSQFQADLSNIREGSILYLGLNYNINETGSLTKPLTLFLGTEVLFSLLGLNGEIHQKLAQDMYTQIRNANSGEKKIDLRFFPDVKREIDAFYSAAEAIVEGKEISFDTVAMKAIINGCELASDVRVRKADFFHRLQFQYGILEDSYDDYYSEENNKYNLESIEHKDEQEQDGWKYVSHVNKRRKGQIFRVDTDSEYLVVTNASNILRASKAQTEIDKRTRELEYSSDYAVSVDRITNILWYKLGYGFGKCDYPTNVNAVLKARIILASNISQNVTKVFALAREQYSKGEISDEQLASRIITLRKKPILPEELAADSIDDSLDFSEEFISRYEEKVRLTESALKEKDDEIERIKEEAKRNIAQKEQSLSTIQQEHKQDILKKDTAIAEKDVLIQQKDIQNRILEEELAKYHERDAEKERKRNKRRNICFFSLSILWKVVILAVIGLLAYYWGHKSGSDVLSIICTVVDFLGLLFFGWTVLKKDVTKYFPKK